jgi:U3 small nucleolar ribonucleoprotein protein IMP4
MLITTSRKPSQKTRTFGRALEKVFPSIYINRGKMSLRDVFLKALDENFSTVLVIHEMKGNPSRLEFYQANETPKLTLLVNVDLNPPPGKINKQKIGLRCDDVTLEKVIQPIIGLKSHKQTYDLLWIKEKNQKLVMEFHDLKGELIKPRIYIKGYEIRDDSDGNS